MSEVKEFKRPPAARAIGAGPPFAASYIEGAFLKNPLLCSLLAQLRGGPGVWLSSDTTGTVQGCAQLARWNEKHRPPALNQCLASQLKDLESYRTLWRAAAEARATR